MGGPEYDKKVRGRRKHSAVAPALRSPLCAKLIHVIILSSVEQRAIVFRPKLVLVSGCLFFFFGQGGAGLEVLVPAPQTEGFREG